MIPLEYIIVLTLGCVQVTYLNNVVMPDPGFDSDSDDADDGEEGQDEQQGEDEGTEEEKGESSDDL